MDVGVVLGQYILCFLHKFSAEGRSGEGRKEGAATITTDNAAATLELVEGRKKTESCENHNSHCTGTASATLMAANRGIHCGFNLYTQVGF